MFRDVVIVRFSVEEVYRGSAANTISIRITKSLGSCGFEYKPGDLFFKKGKQYLVFAGLQNGIFSTTHCSNTRLASDAADEIAQFRNLTKLPPSRIIGGYNIRPSSETKIPGANQKITFRDAHGREVTKTIEADGSFVVTGLMPGSYQLIPTVPLKYRVASRNAYRIADGVRINPESVKVVPNGCTEIAFDAVPDGVLTGRITDSKGKPLSNVTVRLWNPKNVKDVGHWWGGDETNIKGEFQLGPLWSGEYIMGVYIWSPEQERRFRRGEDVGPSLLFYPGVTSASKAKIISLTFAQHRSDIRFRVPDIQQQP